MKIGIYLRVSTLDQSNDSQESQILAFLQRTEWKDEPIEFYRDKISGTKSQRPELDRMLSDCRSGKISRILCYKLDRMGRSVLHLAKLLNDLKGLRIPVIFTSQGFSTEQNNPAGDFFLNMLMAVSEFERSMICERVRAGVKARMDSGKPMGRESLNKSIVGQIRALRSEGKSMGKISRELNLSSCTVHKYLKPA
jgi:DNA invertase Pin-like site-specific DNA recombinase